MVFEKLSSTSEIIRILLFIFSLPFKKRLVTQIVGQKLQQMKVE
jgi:hypothetical protein